MKIIILDNEWSILSDDTNVELKYSIQVEREDKKTGEKKIGVSTRSYHFPSIKFALKKYLDESLKESESIQEVLQQIERVHRTIKNLKV